MGLRIPPGNTDFARLFAQPSKRSTVERRALKAVVIRAVKVVIRVFIVTAISGSSSTEATANRTESERGRLAINNQRAYMQQEKRVKEEKRNK